MFVNLEATVAFYRQSSNVMLPPRLAKCRWPFLPQNQFRQCTPVATVTHVRQQAGTDDVNCFIVDLHLHCQ